MPCALAHSTHRLIVSEVLLKRRLIAFTRSWTLRNSLSAATSRASASARLRAATGRTAEGLPVHSFRTLLADLATLTRNTLVTAGAPEAPFAVTTRPTPLQHSAFALLGLAGTQ